jgi:hypothetical protein
MPLTAAISNQLKSDLLDGVHETADVYKIALVKVSPSGNIDKTLTGYAGLSTDEASGPGYTAGGATLAGRQVVTDGDTKILDWTTDPTWANSTISAIGAIIYNDTAAGKPVLAVLSFGGTITSTNGTFTVTLPAPTAAAGAIRLA